MIQEDKIEIRYEIGEDIIEFVNIHGHVWKMYAYGLGRWYKIADVLDINRVEFRNIVRIFNGYIDDMYVFFKTCDDIESFITTLKLMKI